MRPFPWWRAETVEEEMDRISEKHRRDGDVLREFAVAEAHVRRQRTLALRSMMDAKEPAVSWPVLPSAQTLPGYGPLEEFSAVVGVLCDLPDDPLDTAQDYSVKRLKEFREVVDYKTLLLESDLLSEELGFGIRGLQIRVRASRLGRWTEADGVVEEAETALEELMRIAVKSIKSMRRVTLWTKWRVRLAHWGFAILRMLLLLAAALAGWRIGEVGEPAGLAIQLLITFLSFVILDWVVVDGLIERRLKRRRRTVLKKSAERVTRSLRRVDRDWARANQVLVATRKATDSTPGDTPKGDTPTG